MYALLEKVSFKRQCCLLIGLKETSRGEFTTIVFFVIAERSQS